MSQSRLQQYTAARSSHPTQPQNSITHHHPEDLFYFYYNDCVQFLLHRSFLLLFVMTRSEVKNEIKIFLNLTFFWLSLFNRKPKSIIFLDLIRLPHVQPHNKNVSALSATPRFPSQKPMCLMVDSGHVRDGPR